jgi:hypothetical protein
MKEKRRGQGVPDLGWPHFKEGLTPGIQGKLSDAAIASEKYCIPSDLQSQIAKRRVSTRVGDNLGILDAAFLFLPLAPSFLPQCSFSVKQS